MSTTCAREPVFQLPGSQALELNAICQGRYDGLAVELEASLVREDALRKEMRDSLQRQVLLAREFEHRISNGLQLIAGLLSLQSRAMPTTEACIQLSIAARRVGALGSVHHRLHLLDEPANVEFKGFLVDLCEDLSGLLFQNQTEQVIVVEGAKVVIPSSLASPLGFITNELITNSVKHGIGNVTVRLEKSAPTKYSLSVLDDGPGLPAGYEMAKGKGLGMKLVRWLVEQIGGEFKINPRHDDHRACLTVTFCVANLRSHDQSGE